MLDFVFWLMIILPPGSMLYFVFWLISIIISVHCVVMKLTASTISLQRPSEPHRNVVLWQDHRAVSETNEINSTHHPVLRFVGGALSPEMQPPKLLWLKRHLRQECWEKAGHFFDLADYLTFRATGVSSR